jgi:hypothetical protein
MDAHRLGISPRLREGRLLRRSSRPPFLKSPTNSFFLVSTEIAGEIAG